jgi:hypothetical protein
MVQKADNASPRRSEAIRAIWLPGVALSVLAILLRLLVATRREGIEIDGITYLANARVILQDWRAIHLLHPPLYSLILSPLLVLWTDPEWGARMVSAVLGGLWVWPTLWLARETTEERVAWPAGLLVALMPAAVDASTRVLSEATFGLFLAVLLGSLVRTLRTGSLALACLSGILGGLAALARPEGISYLFLAWAVLLLAPYIVGAPWTALRSLTGILAITVLWFAVLFPYMLIIRNQTGHWHWSGNAGATLRWSESVGDDRPNAFVERVLIETREDDVPAGILAYVAARPKEVARRVIINLHLLDKYTLPGLLQSGGIVLVMLGMLHLRFRGTPVSREWFLLASLTPLAGVLLFHVESRFFVSLIPVLSIVGALGLARVGQRNGSEKPERPSWIGPVLLFVVLLSFVPWILRPFFRSDPGGVEKAAGLWLRRSAGPGAVFIGRYPVITYYAEAPGIPFGRRSLEDMLAEGRKAGARFLIVDSVRLPESRPDLLGLVAGEGGRQDLQLAHVVEDRAGHRVVIYQIRATPPRPASP